MEGVGRQEWEILECPCRENKRYSPKEQCHTGSALLIERARNCGNIL